MESLFRVIDAADPLADALDLGASGSAPSPHLKLELNSSDGDDHGTLEVGFPDGTVCEYCAQIVLLPHVVELFRAEVDGCAQKSAELQTCVLVARSRDAIDSYLKDKCERLEMHGPMHPTAPKFRWVLVEGLCHCSATDPPGNIDSLPAHRVTPAEVSALKSLDRKARAIGKPPTQPTLTRSAVVEDAECRYEYIL